MARFDETFADAFTKSANQASLMAFDRWKQEQQNALETRKLDLAEQELNQGKEVYNVTPEDKLVKIGSVPKGSQVITPYSMMSPEERMNLQVRTAVETAKEKSKLPTADLKNMMVQVDSQIQNINNLKKKASELKGGYAGIGELAKGFVSRGKYGTKETEYMRQAPAYAVSLYRALTGDTRLSDADAQARAYPLLWTPDLDPKMRDSMFSDIEYALKARKQLLEKKKFIQDDSGNPVTDINTVLIESKRLKAKDAGYTDEEIDKYLGVSNGK